ncbi:hypothetical protein BAUCODRAFT_28928 [Baudoinia panamericana UAMH 10762]|uniref:PXA domain-containing protein n=1 Tax=Baudoinia panamericana (strain UAMH 10762) TaxID=717646 RepID=M2MUH9_BAUPA|nr:uncharacterized protein BAUCODRAFT_28928 [Baudoinia panamericana UAMH 10762]EMD00577.1 hypothetical protein BAUCODRAFT_28928 [Baudoinia panamericana UAMH 10762]
MVSVEPANNDPRPTLSPLGGLLHAPSSDGDAQADERDTVAFIRQVLCSTSAPSDTLAQGEPSNGNIKPVEKLLPPLTSNNQIDTQLYAIVAIILKQVVQSWYTKFTSDPSFVAEIVDIIAHCTRGLEERMRDLDYATFLLDEVSAVVDDHIKALQLVREASNKGGVNNLEQTRALFHTLRTHNALSPEPSDDAKVALQQENETVWAQLLVGAILPLVLPPEDMSNPCLNALVSEILSELIVRNAILGRVSEPWLLWEAVTKAIHAVKPKERAASLDCPPPTSRLELAGLVPSPAKRDEEVSALLIPASITLWLSTMLASMWQIATLTWTVTSAIRSAILAASSTPPSHRVATPESWQTGCGSTDLSVFPIRRPVASLKVWSCLGRLLSFHAHMPWLSGLLALLQWLLTHGLGTIGCTDSTPDKIASGFIHTKLLNPRLLPPLLQAIRDAAFPGNSFAPARQPPSPEQTMEIKHACAVAIVGALPEKVRTCYFATQDVELMHKDVEVTLDLFADGYINKHLIVAIIELLVLRLFPELARMEEGR